MHVQILAIVLRGRWRSLMKTLSIETGLNRSRIVNIQVLSTVARQWLLHGLMMLQIVKSIIRLMTGRISLIILLQIVILMRMRHQILGHWIAQQISGRNRVIRIRSMKYSI